MKQREEGQEEEEPGESVDFFTTTVISR